MAETQQKSPVTNLAPEEVSRWLDDGGAVLVDVREPFEHAEERIADAKHAPLSKFDPDAVRAAHPDSKVVFHCRSGKRSADAASRFARDGETTYHLAGGIEAWKAAGHPTVRPAKAARIPVMRQVQIAAGSLVTLGVVLGLLVSPWFLALSAFVGCGLMFAGATGWCGMALFLGKMPWNRVSASGASCAA
ncbi:MAG: rhodanese-like domain-containing protein [Planctomycetota bacterium]|mgnify:CR=1 FL=1|nr:MAG: rhodanese-like domain-containing protein [Planctomycetota bacterium]